MKISVFNIDGGYVEVDASDETTVSELVEKLNALEKEIYKDAILYHDQKELKPEDRLEPSEYSEENPLIAVPKDALSEKTFDDIKDTFDYLEYPFAEFYVFTDNINSFKVQEEKNHQDRKNPFSQRNCRYGYHEKVEVEVEDLFEKDPIFVEHDLQAEKENREHNEKSKEACRKYVEQDERDELFVPNIIVSPMTPIPVIPYTDFNTYRQRPTTNWSDLHREMPVMYPDEPPRPRPQVRREELIQLLQGDAVRIGGENEPQIVGEERANQTQDQTAEAENIENNENERKTIVNEVLTAVEEASAAEDVHGVGKVIGTGVDALADGLDLVAMEEEDMVEMYPEPHYGRIRRLRRVLQRAEEDRALSFNEVIGAERFDPGPVLTEAEQHSVRRLMRLGVDRQYVIEQFEANGRDEDRTRRALIGQIE